MARPIEERIAEQQARALRASQVKARADLTLARLTKQQGGATKRRETREKCVLGWAVRCVLEDGRLSPEVRNRIRMLLEAHISEADRAVVGQWLQREAVQ